MVPTAVELVVLVPLLRATLLAVSVLPGEFADGGEIVVGSIITDVSKGWFALFVVTNTIVVGCPGTGL